MNDTQTISLTILLSLVLICLSAGSCSRNFRSTIIECLKTKATALECDRVVR